MTWDPTEDRDADEVGPVLSLEERDWPRKRTSAEKYQAKTCPACRVVYRGPAHAATCFAHRPLDGRGYVTVEDGVDHA